MSKVRPYLGILVVIVVTAGLWYPKLGYVMPAVIVTLLVTGIYRGRWFCGNLCPRGSFSDFMISKISRNEKIPDTFKKMWLRIPILFALMSLMSFRLANVIAAGATIDKIGMIFVIMCAVTTLIALSLGIFINPRNWCSFCPMGTLQRWFGGTRYQLVLNESKCAGCRICHKVCPMQLEVTEPGHKPDCIKCSKCIAICPKDALKF